VTAVVDLAAMMGPVAVGAEELSCNTDRCRVNRGAWGNHVAGSAGTKRAVALILLPALCMEDSQVSQSTRSASAPMSAQTRPRRCGSRWLRRECHELPRGNSSVVALDGSGGSAMVAARQLVYAMHSPVQSDPDLSLVSKFLN